MSGDSKSKYLLLEIIYSHTVLFAFIWLRRLRSEKKIAPCHEKVFLGKNGKKAMQSSETILREKVHSCRIFNEASMKQLQRSKAQQEYYLVVSNFGTRNKELSFIASPESVLVWW